eukprot:4881106-Pyramimonas_sp.AAC.2
MKLDPDEDGAFLRKMNEIKSKEPVSSRSHHNNEMPSDEPKPTSEQVARAAGTLLYTNRSPEGVQRRVHYDSAELQKRFELYRRRLLAKKPQKRGRQPVDGANPCPF